MFILPSGSRSLISKWNVTSEKKCFGLCPHRKGADFLFSKTICKYAAVSRNVCIPTKLLKCFNMQSACWRTQESCTQAVYTETPGWRLGIYPGFIRLPVSKLKSCGPIIHTLQPKTLGYTPTQISRLDSAFDHWGRVHLCLCQPGWDTSAIVSVWVQVCDSWSPYPGSVCSWWLLTRWCQLLAVWISSIFWNELGFTVLSQPWLFLLLVHLHLAHFPFMFLDIALRTAASLAMNCDVIDGLRPLSTVQSFHDGVWRVLGFHMDVHVQHM